MQEHPSWLQQLLGYFGKLGYMEIAPYPSLVASGTLTPECFCGCFRRNFRYVRIQDVLRPLDARVAPFIHLPLFTQLQLFDSNPNIDPQKIVVESIKSAIPLAKLDFRFASEEWDAESIAARGTGLEVYLNGLEVAQINLLKTMGDISLSSPSLLISFGLDRLSFLLSDASTRPDASIAHSSLRYSSEYLELVCHYLLKIVDGDHNLQEELLHHMNVAEISLKAQDIAGAFENVAKLSTLTEIAYTKGVISRDHRRAIVIASQKLYKSIAIIADSSNGNITLQSNQQEQHDAVDTIGTENELHILRLRNTHQTQSFDNVHLPRELFEAFWRRHPNVDVPINELTDPLSDDIFYREPTLYREYLEFSGLVKWDFQLPLDQIMESVRPMTLYGVQVGKLIETHGKCLEWLYGANVNLTKCPSTLRENYQLRFVELGLRSVRVFPFLRTTIGVLYLRHQGVDASTVELVEFILKAEKLFKGDVAGSSNVMVCALIDLLVTRQARIKLRNGFNISETKRKLGNDPFGIRRTTKVIEKIMYRLEIPSHLLADLEQFADSLLRHNST